ncbi:hypothetical protein DVH24_032710 [Malus domestica]|uniref:Uncharacterized protein n=1 Tax=Malus domestica TaxID=3750 RepID=A0A498J957_MALDO|nr:hypothetical protein DVH24_032710 [Malus domestica]
MPGKVDSVGTGVSGKLLLIQNANTSGFESNLEEFLGFTDPNQNFGVLDRMSPKLMEDDSRLKMLPNFTRQIVGNC